MYVSFRARVSGFIVCYLCTKNKGEIIWNLWFLFFSQILVVALRRYLSFFALYKVIPDLTINFLYSRGRMQHWKSLPQVASKSQAPHVNIFTKSSHFSEVQIWAGISLAAIMWIKMYPRISSCSFFFVHVLTHFYCSDCGSVVCLKFMPSYPSSTIPLFCQSYYHCISLHLRSTFNATYLSTIQITKTNQSNEARQLHSFHLFRKQQSH